MTSQCPFPHPPPDPGARRARSHVPAKAGRLFTGSPSALLLSGDLCQTRFAQGRQGRVAGSSPCGGRGLGGRIREPRAPPGQRLTRDYLGIICFTEQKAAGVRVNPEEFTGEVSKRYSPEKSCPVTAATTHGFSKRVRFCAPRVRRELLNT